MPETNKPRLDPAKLLSDEDVHEAMKKIPGYLDISAGDFKELYLLAYEHAEARLYNSLQVAEIMTTPVVTVFETALLHEVGKLMREKRINRVPVTDNKNRLLGILTRSDLMHAFPERSTP